MKLFAITQSQTRKASPRLRRRLVQSQETEHASVNPVRRVIFLTRSTMSDQKDSRLLEVSAAAA